VSSETSGTPLISISLTSLSLLAVRQSPHCYRCWPSRRSSSTLKSVSARKLALLTPRSQPRFRASRRPCSICSLACGRTWRCAMPRARRSCSSSRPRASCATCRCCAGRAPGATAPPSRGIAQLLFVAPESLVRDVPLLRWACARRGCTTIAVDEAHLALPEPVGVQRLHAEAGHVVRGQIPDVEGP